MAQPPSLLTADSPICARKCVRPGSSRADEDANMAFGEPDQPTAGDEKRGAMRQRVLLSGKVVYGEADLTMDCTIRDLSATGARVRISSPVILPTTIWLIELRSGTAFQCSIARRNVPEFGLHFLRTVKLANNDDRDLKMLRRIWTDCTAR